MPVERIEAHPNVRQDAGRVALQRGPVVYCLEEVDNGAHLADVVVPREAKLEVKFDPKLLEGVAVITGPAQRRNGTDWQGVPYCFWDNRQRGEMQVWLREG